MPTEPQELQSAMHTLQNRLKNDVLPLSAGEEDSLIALSYAGGINGTEIASKILKQVVNQRLLAPKGLFYLLLIGDNHPESFLGPYSFAKTLLSAQRFHNELISIHLLTHPSPRPLIDPNPLGV